MTWTKLGSEFWPECLHHGLSDAAARTHAEAIAYVYEVESMDCSFPKRIVRTFAGSEDAETGIKDLVAIGWWSDDGARWRLVHHSDVIRQSLAAQQKQRVRTKKSSATYRAKHPSDDTPGTTEVTGHVTADVTHDADRQTDKQLGGRPKAVCPHGIPEGAKPQPWFSEGMACSTCAREARSA